MNSRTYESAFRIPKFGHTLLSLLSSVILLLSLAACGGGKSNSTPSNVGGGYTLQVSGGTLNDGSGVNGLSVLATLRDSEGFGPYQTWTITITDPDNNTFTVEYKDPRLGSYMSWEWAAYDPLPGTYRAAATNGLATIYYDFTVTAGTISRPAPNASSPSASNTITISWPPVDGAGSYSYDVCSPSSTCVSGITTSTSEIVSFATLTPGDYLIQVKAFAIDRQALYADHTSSPAFASQEKVSEYSFSYPVGTTVNPVNYELKAAGGILDYGFSGGPAGPIYGLAIWTSLQDVTTGNPVAPTGDWNIVITAPSGTVMNYIYPANERHYAYWYYGIEPVIGAYTVTATYGTASTTAVFTIASTVSEMTTTFPLPTGISASLSGDDINITWNQVTGAQSYYVSLYADVWNSGTQQYDYIEVWGAWVKTAATVISKSTSSIPAALQGYAYITAYEVDMTSAAPPVTTPTRADMSENYYAYQLPFLTP
ncbi:MAG: hypothetical protein AABZ10_01220 [Nitrospirota bacterium]